jgi:pimeloyl-ACP methyl ester carboxylesterase
LLKNLLKTRSSVRAGAFAATLAAAVVTVPASQAAVAHAGHHDEVKPSIVLLHGAWADSSAWDGVISRLQARGYKVYVPPNPLLGLTYDSATLANFLHTLSGPIVLVGHSYGGAVITNAATGDSQVKALVYVDAFAPDKGDTLGQLVNAVPGTCTVPQNLTFSALPDAPDGVVDAYIKPDVFHSCMANDLPSWKSDILAATQRPLSTIALNQPSGEPAWATIPSWSVVGTVDHAIPPAEQLAMDKKAGAHVTEIKSSHLPMISQPDTVTDVILQAVHATNRP